MRSMGPTTWRRVLVPVSVAAAVIMLSVRAVLALPAPQPLTAREDPLEALDGNSMVFFLAPRPDETVYGEVEVEVEALYEGVLEVRLFVDAEEKGRSRNPPHRFTVFLGEDYGPHSFEAVAYGAEGELGRSVRHTPGIAVDDVLDIELQQLYVTVSSKNGSSRGLTPADFEIRDLGDKQEIVTFEGGHAALTVAVLIDASASMAGGRLAAALAGAEAFFRGMREFDEAAVFLFSDVLRWRTPFSENPLELSESLRSVTSKGGTAMNDALYRAMRELEGRQGKRVIILLSDGIDIHSLLDVEDVIWVAQRSRSVVYWIELREGDHTGVVTSHWRDREGHDAEIDGLRRLVDDSGGRIVPITHPDRAVEAFGSILAELREQYVLGYYPSLNLDDGRWHRVKVKVNRPGLKVRTRGGYIDY